MSHVGSFFIACAAYSSTVVFGLVPTQPAPSITTVRDYTAVEVNSGDCSGNDLNEGGLVWGWNLTAGECAEQCTPEILCQGFLWSPPHNATQKKIKNCELKSNFCVGDVISAESQVQKSSPDSDASIFYRRQNPTMAWEYLANPPSHEIRGRESTPFKKWMRKGLRTFGIPAAQCASDPQCKSFCWNPRGDTTYSTKEPVSFGTEYGAEIKEQEELAVKQASAKSKKEKKAAQVERAKAVVAIHLLKAQARAHKIATWKDWGAGVLEPGWKCYAKKCVATDVVGRWKQHSMVLGVQTYTVKKGTVKTNSYTNESSWTNSVAAQMSVGGKFAGIGAEVSVSGEISKGWSKQFAEELQLNVEKEHSFSIGEAEYQGKYVWQFVLDITDQCTELPLTTKTKNWALTGGVTDPPCCLPGHCDDSPFCTRCKTAEALILTDAAHCSVLSTTFSAAPSAPTTFSAAASAPSTTFLAAPSATEATGGAPSICCTNLQLLFVSASLLLTHMS